MKRLFLLAALLLMCAPAAYAQVKGSQDSMENLPPVPASPTQHCKTVGDLPDSQCTPGVTNPNVTQANISQTICSTHWHGRNPYTGQFATGTKVVRPPSSYTSKLKRLQMQEYGLKGGPGDYEEDHLISLELGGNPVDPRNLWPESPHSPNPKDGFENYLHYMVCHGGLTLAEAQQEIATDWVKYWTEAGKPKGAADARRKLAHH